MNADVNENPLDTSIEAIKTLAAKMAVSEPPQDPALCPFCARPATDWDIELCEHLIADFDDGSNNDRGALCGPGGSRCGNESLECLSDLESAWKDFVAVVGTGESDEMAQSGYADALGSALHGANLAPKWWSTVDDSALEQEGDDWRAVQAIWQAVVPWSPDLVSTEAIVGGMMMMSTATFVWARYPTQSAQAIASGVARAEADIRAATTQLVKQGRHINTDPLERKAPEPEKDIENS